jgi:hypothetical protein
MLPFKPKENTMRRRGIAQGASALAFTTAIAFAGRASAEEPALAPPPNPPPPATAEAHAEGSAAVGGNAQGSGAMTLPAREPDPPARARVAPGDSEHDQVVGTLAIGYLGRRTMVVGCSPGTEGTQPGEACGGGNRQNLNVPVIGIRYWISGLIGIDAGLGMAINSLSGSNPGGDIARPSSTAFMLHGGVPLALASSGHFTFEVIPEMNLGFSSYSMDLPAGTLSGSGLHFDIGARAGAEIHFGFIGIPKLSLLGTIGLAFALEDSKSEAPGGGNTNRSEISFATSVQDSPWNIFTSNVAALYYF